MHQQCGFVGPGDALVRLDDDYAFAQAGNDLLKLRAINRIGQGHGSDAANRRCGNQKGGCPAASLRRHIDPMMNGSGL
jgi:hypothetical protein